MAASASDDPTVIGAADAMPRNKEAMTAIDANDLTMLGIL